MSVVTYVVIALLVVATGLTWLIRENRIFLIACLLIAPLPAAVVMVFFAEGLPGDLPAAQRLRFVVASLICYAVVWLSLLAGWLSGQIRDEAAP